MPGYSIIFNNMDSGDLDLIVENVEIPSPAKRMETVKVDGRDGDLYRDTGNYEDVAVKATFSFLSADASEWYDTFSLVRNWLFGKYFDDELMIGTIPGYYRRVKSVSMDTPERVLFKTGKFVFNFICDPWEYSVIGRYETDLGSAYHLDFPCSPVYYFSGEGSLTITVNGNSVTLDVGGNVVVDTDRMLVFRKITSGNVMVSAEGASLEDLRLIAGDNTLSWTSGFTGTIRPNWRRI